jgi:hypothetical protein
MAARKSTPIVPGTAAQERLNQLNRLIKETAARAKKAEAKRKQEQLNRLIKGTSFRSFILKIVDDLKNTHKRVQIALEYAHRADNATKDIGEKKLAPLVQELVTLVARLRMSPGTDAPAPKMLTSQRGSQR